MVEVKIDVKIFFEFVNSWNFNVILFIIFDFYYFVNFIGEFGLESYIDIGVYFFVKYLRIKIIKKRKVKIVNEDFKKKVRNNLILKFFEL